MFFWLNCCRLACLNPSQIRGAQVGRSAETNVLVRRPKLGWFWGSYDDRLELEKVEIFNGVTVCNFQPSSFWEGEEQLAQYQKQLSGTWNCCWSRVHLPGQKLKTDDTNTYEYPNHEFKATPWQPQIIPICPKNKFYLFHLVLPSFNPVGITAEP